jgi:sugar phosphate isomerase/epimerase
LGRRTPCRDLVGVDEAQADRRPLHGRRAAGQRHAAAEGGSLAKAVTGLWEPNPNRVAALETFKQRCEMFARLGLTHTYSPSTTTQTFTQDDYKIGADNMREAAEIATQFRLTVMAEAVRASTFMSTLTTLLKLTREAAHPKPLLDIYHFCSGLSRLEDLDLIRGDSTQ